ncbi:hypothetical protein NDU88_002761 [Pleurodeles waltl]|uniref:Uncharacterized protein n=1 Tax=Pleurodeles waltl TaxID=8319 RepID=A0AAV7MQL5_PLEWA|nr:hypothetical protein NDU88_002761 [Pleurodeles waltl]
MVPCGQPLVNTAEAILKQTVLLVKLWAQGPKLDVQKRTEYSVRPVNYERYDNGGTLGATFYQVLHYYHLSKSKSEVAHLLNYSAAIKVAILRCPTGR